MMINLMRFSEKKTYIFNASLIVLYLIQFITFCNNSHYGLDFTDESFYILNSSYPENNLFSRTHFGYFLKPLYIICNGNISNYRVLSFLIYQIVIIIFSISLIDYIKTIFRSKINLNKYELIFFNLNISFLYYFISCNISPSYNYLNLIFVLLFNSGLFMSIKENKVYTFYSSFLIILSIVCSFFIKPSTTIFLSIILTFWFFFQLRKKILFLIFSLFSIVLLLIVINFFTEKNFLVELMEKYNNAISINRLYPNTTLLSSSKKLLRLVTELVFNPLLIGIGTMIYFNKKYNIIKRNSIQIFITIALFFLSYKLNFLNIYYLKFGANINLTWLLYYHVLYLFILHFLISKIHKINLIKFSIVLFLTILIYISKSQFWILNLLSVTILILISFNIYKSQKNILNFIILMFLLSFAYSFGTSTPYEKAMIGASLLVCSALYVVIYYLLNTSKNRLKNIMLFAIVILSFQSMIGYKLYPYRQLRLTNENTVNTTLRLNSSFNLKLHKNDNEYISKIENLALENGWNENSRVIDLTGKTPAINIILNSPFIGKAWLLGGNAKNNKKNNHIISNSTFKKDENLWLLVEDSSEFSRKVDISFLNFPNDYIKLGVTKRISQTKEFHSLWKHR